MKVEHIIGATVFIGCFAIGALLPVIHDHVLPLFGITIFDDVPAKQSSPIENWSLRDDQNKKESASPGRKMNFTAGSDNPDELEVAYNKYDDRIEFSGNAPSSNQKITITLEGENRYWTTYTTNSDDVGEWHATIYFEALPNYMNSIVIEAGPERGRPMAKAEITEYIAPPTLPESEITIELYGSAPLEISDLELGNEFIKALFTGSHSVYRAGVVRGGEFDSYQYFFADKICEMYCSPGYNKFLVNPEFTELVILGNGYFEGYFRTYSNEGPGFLENSKYIKRRPNLTNPLYTYPEKIFLKNSNYNLITPTESSIDTLATNPEYELVDWTFDGQPVYFHTERALFALQLADGRTVRYRYDIPFMLEGKQPQISWFDGTVNQSDYQLNDITGGCGMPSNALAIRPDISPADLETPAYTWTGIAPTNERFYTITDPLDERLVDLHERFGWRGWGENRESVAYDDFIASRPLVYWVTPHNMVVEMRRADYRPLAECGKPVVYLYPEEEIEATVFVDLKGPMTVSEPEHGPDGWSVTARPDGYVVNHEDGEVYPNLFWEGFGVTYETPEEGFVVAGEEVETWLPKTLTEIGFSEREKDEFLEFWLPKIPKAPYVFFTFIDQSHFDRDAALLIEPKPDNVSRVFMEYYPLASFKEVTPQELPTINRQGYYVVEWGGLLYR